MKKFITIFVGVIIASSFTGCSKQDQTVTVNTIAPNQAAAVVKTGQPVEEHIMQSAEDIPDLLNNILVDVSFTEIDSLNNVYGEMTYTNNTGMTITSYNLVCMRKDTNEKVYYDCYDTVLNGEKSPVFRNFGPTSRDVNDLQTLTESVTYLDADGVQHTLECDYKLGKYTIS